MKEFPLYFKITCYTLLVATTFFVMYIGRNLFVPLAISVLLAFLLMPVSNWFEKRGLHRIPAVLLSIFLMMVLIAALIFFLSTQFISFSEEIPVLQEKLADKFIFIQRFISERFQVSDERQMEWLKGQLESFLSSGGQFIGSVFSATGNFLAAATLVPIYIFFISYYRSRFVKFVRALTPPENHHWVLGLMQSTARVSQKYLIGLIIDVSILSVLNSIGFLILGIKHAILLGVVAGILNIIPYIGVLIGSIFPILMALITKDSVWYAVGALGVCVFVQFLDNNFITPNIVGSAVSINPPSTMIALIVGGMMWGVAGMMLFIPYLGMVKVIFDNIDELRPLGVLIGDEVKKQKNPEPDLTDES